MLRQGDHDWHFEFSCDIHGILEDNQYMGKRIPFSDKATFTLNRSLPKLP